MTTTDPDQTASVCKQNWFTVVADVNRAVTSALRVNCIVVVQLFRNKRFRDILIQRLYTPNAFCVNEM